MIVNRYPGKCQSCNTKLAAGEGFAYKNGHRWFNVCASTACHRRLGLESPVPESKQERKLTEEGHIFMPYDRDAIPLLRSLPGAHYKREVTPNHWAVSVKTADLPRVIEVAEQLRLEIPDSLRARAQAGTSELREALSRVERKRSDGKELFHFQRKGVEFLALHDRALLADDMGLGKTVQALVALPANEPVVVIAPAAVKYNWRDEIEMWRPDYRVHICNGRDSFELPEPGEIVITNYEILPSWLSPTKDTGKRTRKGEKIKVADLTVGQAAKISEITLICDEAQKAKNYKAARTQKVRELSKNTRRVWLLTGTPVMNKPGDLFGILQSGNMFPLGNWSKFVFLFNGTQNPFGGYEFGMPEPEVPERLKRVMIRRLKTEVLKDLPPKRYQRIEVNDMSRALKSRLDSYIITSALVEGLLAPEDAKKTLKDAEKLRAMADKLDMTSLPAFEEFSEIRALLAEARIPAMLEEVESYEDSDTPLVVFSAHKKPIRELAKREGWEIITGDIPAAQRAATVKRFQNGELKGVGLTIEAGGLGITLTRASHALFVDLDWTPANNIQAEDRICRIGQTSNNVLIKRMSSTHPLDRHMQKLIEYKIELAYRTLEASIKFTPPRPRPLAQDIKIIEETEDELRARLQAAEDEANREIAIGKLQRVAGREAAKVNDVPEPELTPKRKSMLRDALAYMVSICDHATSRDGMGFNKPDASIGHWIHATGLRDEDELAFRVLERILVRYRRQLKDQFAAIWKPDM